MFGDYEAQRHWMEITHNLPSREWYFNTSNNDLQYWGLDYPPLTAYHSKLCGDIAALINSDFVALGSSRGYESNSHKLFMRATVLVADLLILFPAICFYWRAFKRRTEERKGEGDDHQSQVNSSLVWRYLALLYPGLILIDHGHFQYNNISLGLVIAAVMCIVNNKNLTGSALFTLSLSYKQMSLYYALPFFFYLLGYALQRGIKSGIAYITLLGATVLGTFSLIWAPFLTDIDQFLQVLHRLFPLARGVFEDKVANVWCAVNVVYKLRFIFSNERMAQICLCTTALSVLPSCINIYLKPKQDKFILALINSSLAFFLFSYQVHEKSILLVATPILLYYPNDPLACLWFLIISIFSMLPLLIKDGLIIPTISLTLFYLVSAHLMVNLFSFGRNKASSKPQEKTFISQIPFKKISFYLSLSGCAILTFCTVAFKPPNHLPDLFPLLVSVYSCAHFCVFFIYFNYCQLRTPSHPKLKKN